MEDKTPEGIDNRAIPALESDPGPFDIFGRSPTPPRPSPNAAILKSDRGPFDISRQKGYHINRKDTLGSKEMRFSRNH